MSYYRNENQPERYIKNWQEHAKHSEDYERKARQSSLLPSCKVAFGIFLQNTIVQTEIRNFSQKMGTIDGRDLPLD